MYRVVQPYQRRQDKLQKIDSNKKTAVLFTRSLSLEIEILKKHTIHYLLQIHWTTTKMQKNCVNERIPVSLGAHSDSKNKLLCDTKGSKRFNLSKFWKAQKPKSERNTVRVERGDYVSHHNLGRDNVYRNRAGAHSHSLVLEEPKELRHWRQGALSSSLTTYAYAIFCLSFHFRAILLFSEKNFISNFHRKKLFMALNYCIPYVSAVFAVCLSLF